MANNGTPLSSTPETDLDNHSSSEDSDDTIVQTELLKQLNVPLASESDDEESREDSGSNLSNEQFDQSLKEINTKFKTVVPRTRNQQQSKKVSIESKPVVTPKKVSNTVQANEQAKPSSSKTVTTAQNNEATEAEHLKRHTDPKVKPSQSHGVTLNRLKRTRRMQKSVTLEIARRRKLLKDVVEGKKPVVGGIKQTAQPNVASPAVKIEKTPVITSQSIQSIQKPTPLPSVWSLGRIPKLSLSLDPEIVKASINKLGKRRKWATSYSVLAEILRVKRLLANGNPFRVIPQHAYDISKVPGILRPHIQKLLEQWQNYFSDYLYQIIQMEYSIEYNDIEKRIALMSESGDKFNKVCEFQSFIGGEEELIGNLYAKKNVSEGEPEPKNKKAKVVSQAPIPKSTNSGKESRKSKGKEMVVNGVAGTSQNDYTF